MTLLLNLQQLKNSIDHAVSTRGLNIKVSPSPDNIPFVTYEAVLVPDQTFGGTRSTTITLHFFARQLDQCFDYLQQFINNFQWDSNWAEERIVWNYIFDFQAYRLSYTFTITIGQS